MKKIGILANRGYIDKHTYDIITHLLAHENVILFVLLIDMSNLSRSFREKTYDALFTAEKKLFSLFSSELKAYSNRVPLPQIADENMIYLTPAGNAETNILYFSPDDMQKVAKLQLDLIVNVNNAFTLDGEILEKGTKDGMIGINHQKKAAFWEIYMRKDSISFTIEKYTHSGSAVLFSGTIATMRTVSEMKVRLLREASPYLIRTVEDYLHDKPLKRAYEPFIFDIVAYRVPTFLQQIGYVFKTFSLYALLVYRRIFLKKYTRFSVAFLWQNWENAKLHRGTVIETPPGHFYADPFVWTKEGRHVCFLEDYDYSQNIAWISAVELFEDGSYTLLGEVVKEPFHLSFPYLFEYEDRLYMIPESSAAGTVRLYECIEFPLRWKYRKDLMQNVRAADTMVFYHGDRWWMFTNMTTPDNDDQAAQLFIYHSDNPLSDTGWKAHTLNPVVFNSNYGRNGGILDAQKDFPVRVRQKQKFNVYGASFSIARICELTPDRYVEQYLCDVEPDFFPDARATHHIHSHNGISVYDFMRHERL